MCMYVYIYIYIYIYTHTCNKLLWQLRDTEPPRPRADVSTAVASVRARFNTNGNNNAGINDNNNIIIIIIISSSSTTTSTTKHNNLAVTWYGRRPGSRSGNLPRGCGGCWTRELK